MNALRYFTSTIRASVGGVTTPVKIETPDSDFYRFMSLPALVEISINDGPWMPASVAPAFQIKEGDPKIERISLRNQDTQDVTYRMVTGRGTLMFVPDTDVKEPKTEAVGAPATTIGAATTVTYSPTLNGLRIRRKAIVVNNYDPAVQLFVRDVNGNKVATVFPNQSVILPISETIQIRNDGGSAVSYAFGEIYWTL